MRPASAAQQANLNPTASIVGKLHAKGQSPCERLSRSLVLRISVVVKNSGNGPCMVSGLGYTRRI